MKSSRNLKVGVTLLVIALAVGVLPSSFGQMVMEQMERME